MLCCKHLREVWLLSQPHYWNWQRTYLVTHGLRHILQWYSRV